MREDPLEYFGGREKIQTAWRETLRDKLSPLPGGTLVAIERHLFPDPQDKGILGDIIQGTRFIASSLFEKFACPLGVSATGTLEFEGELSPEEEKYWIAEMEATGARVAGSAEDAGDESGDSKPVLNVRLYIMLRALEEMETES